MIVFPHAKINLGLNVLEKRPDGFHHIESLFYPIRLSDVLEIIENRLETGRKIEMTGSGLPMDCAVEDNLVYKAAERIALKYSIPNIQIHLHKIIPSGAGLGGGSSDASFTIKLLNELFDLNISVVEMKKIAGELGADCTYFIEGGTQIVKGVGDELEIFSMDLSSYFIVVVKPIVHINTANAYLKITPHIPNENVASVLLGEVKHWKENLKNDFEAVAIRESSQIEKFKFQMYDSGAEYASMTGSGSAVYGLFKDKPSLNLNKDDLFVWTGRM